MYGISIFLAIAAPIKQVYMLWPVRIYRCKLIGFDNVSVSEQLTLFYVYKTCEGQAYSTNWPFSFMYKNIYIKEYY